MGYKEKYEAWLNDPYMDEATHAELLAIKDDEKEIEDRFYQDLEFGTAGLRGKVGAGTNRMNVYTVARATEGFSRLIDDHGEEAKKAGIVISRDIRHMSEEFARLSAEIFAAHGIHVYIFETIQATPILSYSVRALGTHAGLMITASHNPREYNGYKAYGTEGSQILDGWAKGIESRIAQVTDYSSIPRMDFEEGLRTGMIEYVSEQLLDTYRKKVLALTIHDELVDKNVAIVYSPLNGCGSIPVQDILARRGFTNIHVVKEQEHPDPDFSTVGYPNPEDPKAFKYAEALGKSVNADILMATDPDSDRVALEVRDKDGEYRFINGNRIGALLINYIVSQLHELGRLPKDGAIVKSIVTGDIAFAIGEKYGLSVYNTLTGFKNISAPVNEWDTTHEHTFVFGYEESIGFNHGEFVRDKDAISSCMLVAEMAGFYKKRGMSLLDALEEIFKTYGYYNENLVSIILEGLDGKARINRIMEDFRNRPIMEIAGAKLVKTIDYANDETGLPKSNVLIYHYDNKSWYAVRPSGTEPKIKLYMYTVGETEKESADRLTEIKRSVDAKVESVQ